MDPLDSLRPHVAATAPPSPEALTAAELRAWAVRVLDRSGLRYADRHVDQLAPLLGHLAATSPVMRGNRAQARAQRRAARRARA